MPHHPQGPCDRQPWGSCERPHLPSPSMGVPGPLPLPIPRCAGLLLTGPTTATLAPSRTFPLQLLTPSLPRFGRHLPPTALSGPTGRPSLEGLHPTLENIKQNVTEVMFAHRSPRAGLNVPSPGHSRMRRGGGGAWAWISGPRGCLGPCLVGSHGQCLITQRRKWGDEGRDCSGYMAGQSWEATRVLASRSPHLGTSVPPPAAKEGQGLSLGHLLTLGPRSSACKQSAVRGDWCGWGLQRP